MDAARDFRYWLKWAAAARRTTVNEAPATTIGRELRVHPRTIRRWEAENRAPGWALQVLMMLADGVPIGAGAEWSGWRFARQSDAVRLVGPDGHAWSPDELLAYRTTCTRARELERRLEGPAQLTWLPLAGGRASWPGGAVPSWLQLEQALRDVVDDQVRRSRA